MSVATGHGTGGDERIENGLLGGISHRLEEQVDAVLVQDADIDQRRVLVVREHIGCCEAERNVTTAVAPEGSEARESDAGAADDTLQLPVTQRNVRGRDDDDRALLHGTFLYLNIRRSDDPAIRKAQIAGPSEIGQDEYAEMKILATEGDPPGRGANAALEAEGAHAAARTHRADIEMR